MILLSAQQIGHAYGARTLFEKLSFSIESGERIGLIGPNGAGKSTLLKILSGALIPDQGSLALQRGLKIAYLEQVPSFENQESVESAVLGALQDPHDWEELGIAQEYLSKLSLDGSRGVYPHTLISTLSGGWKKRVALARELVKKPDLFLLDEPTNHLDIESILELEALLNNSGIATLSVTHDRVFLQKVSNRILELDRRNPNGLLSVKGDYASYLELKEQLLHEQNRREAVLKNTLRREIEWLRRGPKARGTKQQARIQRADQIKDEVEKLGILNQNRQAGLDFQESERKPKKLLEAEGLCKSYDEQIIFSGLDLILTPKSRVALLGNNGCGKSTMIRVLLGQEKADDGKLKHAEQLQVAYFEQNRETLNPEINIMKTLCPSGDHVAYRGNFIHIRSYLDRFLFSPAQMELKVGKLSGGEQSRLLIAKLMLQPANILVLDEPTNDLDVATLEVLEDCLRDFEGAILLVTHDRYFLSQIANQILAFPPEGSDPQKKIVSLADLDQWEDWTRLQKKNIRNAPVKQEEKIKSAEVTPKKAKKLSFNEQREMDAMENKIHQAEARLEELQAASIHPDHISHANKLVEITKEMESLRKEIERLYARWAELESKTTLI